MITEQRVEIDAPPARVWAVCVDVERWPEWTTSVDRITPLDEPGLEVGRRFAVEQPRFPKLVWEVTEVVPERSWTWRQRSPGGLTLATHEVTPRGEGGSSVRLVVEQRGPVGVLVGFLARGLTRRYLQLEADGLKARSEAG